jgi:hypothetical protein
MYKNHLHSNSFNATTSNDLEYIGRTFNIHTRKATQILCVYKTQHLYLILHCVQCMNPLGKSPTPTKRKAWFFFTQYDFFTC